MPTGASSKRSKTWQPLSRALGAVWQGWAMQLGVTTHTLGAPAEVRGRLLPSALDGVFRLALEASGRWHQGRLLRRPWQRRPTGCSNRSK